MKIRDPRDIQCRLPIADLATKAQRHKETIYKNLSVLVSLGLINNRKSRSGFVLTLVIVAILIIGIEMFVLAGMANTMQFQSHRAYLKACERNLQASGLAWARQNAPKSRGKSPGQTMKLDVSEMDIIGSALEVSISATDDDRPDIRIHTSCSRGRQTLKGSRTYKIE